MGVTLEADCGETGLLNVVESSFDVALGLIGLGGEHKSWGACIGHNTSEEVVSIYDWAVPVLERRLQKLVNSIEEYTCDIGVTAFEQQPSYLRSLPEE